MHTFIEENKRLLKPFYLSANILGVLLLIFGCSATIFHFYEIFADKLPLHPFVDFYFDEVPWNYIECVPFGLLVLGLGQFIKYIFDEDASIGWVLKHSQSIIYFFIVYHLVTHITNITLSILYDWPDIIERMIFFPLAIFWLVGVLLLLLAMSLIVKRVIPMVEESKTLV